MRNEIRPLTSIRFLVSLYVFFFHFQIRWPITHKRFEANILSQGATGMTCFFMLSGFILAYNASGNISAVKKYAVSRFARIYPIYALGGLITLPFIALGNLSSWNGGQISKCFTLVLVIIVNVLLLQAWFPPLFGIWNDGGSWSISTETFFYCVFPTLLRSIRTSKFRMEIILVACYLFMILLGLACTLFPNSTMAVAYSVPIFRLGEFTSGVVLYELVSNMRKKELLFYSKLGFYVLLPILILDLGLIGNNLGIYIGHDWIVLPFFGTILVFLFASPSDGNKLLSSRFLNLLGKASYSFYSVQAFFILFLLRFRTNIVQRLHFLDANVWLCLCTYILLQLTAIICYRFLEVPARRYIKTRLT